MTGPKGRQRFPSAASTPGGCPVDKGGPTDPVREGRSGPTVLTRAAREPHTPGGSMGMRQVGGGAGKVPQQERAHRQLPIRGRPPEASLLLFPQQGHGQQLSAGSQSPGAKWRGERPQGPLTLPGPALASQGKQSVPVCQSPVLQSVAVSLSLPGSLSLSLFLFLF